MIWLWQLWAKIKVGFAFAAAAIAAIAILYAKARRDGIEEMQREQYRSRVEAMRKRKELDNEIDSYDDDDVRRTLDEWLRDN